MRIFLAAAALSVLLAGCGKIDDNNHGYGFEYDFAFADGTRFRNDPPGLMLDQDLAEHYVAKVYRSVEECTQILAPGPLVVAVPDGTFGTFGGVTYVEDALIVVVDPWVQDGWATIYSVLRHEMVHYLLGYSGLSAEDNREHRSPLFAECSQASPRQAAQDQGIRPVGAPYGDEPVPAPH